MTRIPYMYGNIDIDNPGLAQVWIFRIWETTNLGVTGCSLIPDP